MQCARSLERLSDGVDEILDGCFRTLHRAARRELHLGGEGTDVAVGEHVREQAILLQLCEDCLELPGTVTAGGMRNCIAAVHSPKPFYSDPRPKLVPNAAVPDGHPRLADGVEGGPVAALTSVGVVRTGMCEFCDFGSLLRAGARRCMCTFSPSLGRAAWVRSRCADCTA
jgi:hypothetical protein